MKWPDQNELKVKLLALKTNPKAVLGIVAVFLLLDVAIFLRGQFFSLARMFGQANQLKTSIRRTVNDVHSGETYKNRLKDLKAELLSLDKMVVADQDLQAAMELISKYADTSVVRILKIKPEGEGKAEVRLSGKDVASKTGDVFIRQRISIYAKSGFHQLGRLIGLLESSPVFFDIKNLEIRSDEQEYLRQSVTIVLEVVSRKV